MDSACPLRDWQATILPIQGKCHFCESTASCLAENDHAFAILDRHPVARGHALVIPKPHVASIFELPPDAYSVWDRNGAIAEMLSAFIGERTAGYIFQTSKGTALGQRNLLRDSLHPILKIMKHDPCGFHAFRRYRITHLRKHRTQEDLLDYWVGHSPETVTDGYVKIKGDLDYRKAEVERVGIGFNLGSCPFKSLEGMLVN